jgi:hypothetical protein
MSTIGLPVARRKDFKRLASRAVSEGEAVPVDVGEYRVLRSETGAELWAGVDRRGKLRALTPHFGGSARTHARMLQRIARADDTIFDGTLDGWAVDGLTAAAGDESRDITPLRFDVPDARAHATLRLPAVAEVQIAAFAYESSWTREVAAFKAAQATEELPFADQAFAYLDVFDEDPERPADAMLTGRVVQTEVRVNELTDVGFRWASVVTLIGEIDVVADPAVVAGEPTAGGVVEGTFWLSGRIRNIHSQSS